MIADGEYGGSIPSPKTINPNVYAKVQVESSTLAIKPRELLHSILGMTPNCVWW